jgi:hypothetical protein
MNTEQMLGSQTAKKGFQNEEDIVAKFNNWKQDGDAQKWLSIIQKEIKKIESVTAQKLSGFKTDVQIRVITKAKAAVDMQNLQIKLVSNPKGFNQIDKRWVDRYIEMWNIPAEVVSILKRYTGEIKPTIPKPQDKRRMFANEFSQKEQTLILKWLTNNKSLIVADILKGRGPLAAEWTLVAQKTKQASRWILKPMNDCLNYFGSGPVEITARGNFKIGRITMQRKGGDGGRSTANMLQFKINPAELFDEV